MIAAEQWSKSLALLTMSRASNLPTVWSNCVAGWALAGGRDTLSLAALLFSASLIYIGGMFLNDAVDADFDREYRVGRPIPSGAITVREAWAWGGTCLILAVLCLVSVGHLAAITGAILALCVVLYDLVHKKSALAPWLMAVCRVLVYLLAASIGGALPGVLVWSAVALGFYIAGLSYLARDEVRPELMSYWPCTLLIVPVVLAALVNDGGFQRRGMLFSAILLAWLLWSFRPLVRSKGAHLPETVGGLLAGIVWVDMLAAGIEKPQTVIVFILLFILARLGQRWIPAT